MESGKYRFAIVRRSGTEVIENANLFALQSRHSFACHGKRNKDVLYVTNIHKVQYVEEKAK